MADHFFSTDLARECARWWFCSFQFRMKEKRKKKIYKIFDTKRWFMHLIRLQFVHFYQTCSSSVVFRVRHKIIALIQMICHSINALNTLNVCAANHTKYWTFLFDGVRVCVFYCRCYSLNISQAVARYTMEHPMWQCHLNAEFTLVRSHLARLNPKSTHIACINLYVLLLRCKRHIRLLSWHNCRVNQQYGRKSFDKGCNTTFKNDYSKWYRQKKKKKWT